MPSATSTANDRRSPSLREYSSSRGSSSPLATQAAFGDVPRHWFGGSALKTHVLNAMHVVLVYGERFMIRVVNETARELSDPELRAKVEWFSRQEADHAREHRAFWRALQDQGYSVDGFADFCEWIEKRILNRFLSARLRLATSVAIEHNTAVFSELALGSELFAQAHPEPRDLFEWHCHEEIEHREVVFDVLTAVSERSFGWRMAGMALAVLVLSGVVGAGVAVFLGQDLRRQDLRQRCLFLGRALRDSAGLFFTREALLVRGMRAGWVYFKRDFHPRQLGSRLEGAAFG